MRAARSPSATALPGSGPALRLWRLAVAWPLASIVLLTLAQHGLTVDAKDLWFSDEVRHGGVLRDLLERGDWLALKLNGTLYPDKPPVYFWYLAGLATLFGSTAPWVIYVGLAGTVFMLYVATHRMALRLTGDPATALLSVLVLASGYYFATMTHYARMDHMFAAAIAASWTAFFTGMRGELRRGAILAGFGFMALAAMIKGPVGIMFPALSLVGFALWRRRPGWLLDRSVIGGLGIVAGVTALWAGGIVAIAGPDYFAHLFETQIVDRGLNKDSGSLGMFRYAVTLPLIFLPWTLLVLVVPWRRSGGLSAEAAFLWITAGLGFVALSLVAEKHEYYLVPVLVPLAILAARGYAALDVTRARLFWGLTLGLTGLLGAILAVASRVERTVNPDVGDYAPAIPLLELPGFLLLAGAVLLWPFRGAARPLIAAGFVLLQAVFVTATAIRVFPAVDAVLSPSLVTDEMRPYTRVGHAPGILHGRDGVFAYHLGMHYTDFPLEEEVWPWLDATPRAVLALPAEVWWPVADRHPEAGAAACVRFAGRPILVVAKPPPERRATRSDCARP